MGFIGMSGRTIARKEALAGAALVAQLCGLGIVDAADEPERARAAMANESAECAAYFNTASQAPGLDAQTKDGLRSDARSLVKLSSDLTSEKLARTRANLGSRAMLRDISDDWTKASLLDSKYKDPCKALVVDPKARMQYWINKGD